MRVCVCVLHVAACLTKRQPRVPGNQNNKKTNNQDNKYARRTSKTTRTTTTTREQSQEQHQNCSFLLKIDTDAGAEEPQFFRILRRVLCSKQTFKLRLCGVHCGLAEFEHRGLGHSYLFNIDVGVVRMFVLKTAPFSNVNMVKI